MQIHWIKNTKNKVISQGGIYFIKMLFEQHGIDSFINRWQEQRPVQSRYRDSDILLSLGYCSYTGGDYLEDINRIRQDFNKKDEFKMPSSDTITYRINQLIDKDIYLAGKKNVTHQFNYQPSLNQLLVNLSVHLNPQWKKTGQVLDYDNTIIETTKGDCKKTYKGNTGYQPGVMFINRCPVYVEGRNGNSNSIFDIENTLKRSLDMLTARKVRLSSIRIDGAGFKGETMSVLENYPDLLYYIRGRNAHRWWSNYNKTFKATLNELDLEYQDTEPFIPGKNPDEKVTRAIVYRYKKEEASQKKLFEDHNYIYYIIYTNDYKSTPLEIITHYNNRGTAEQNYDRLKNDFNWKHPPYPTLAQNTVYFIFMAIANILYQWLLTLVSQYFKGIDLQTRMKRFIFLFVNVPCKWTYRGRRNILNVYANQAYYKLITDT
ncbi:MAG: IS1380 family transposase [Bacteroidetes bacterium]|jgi:hypothetical protein|nr:IS1380 family transposase [Bacteroidota bacterium]